MTRIRRGWLAVWTVYWSCCSVIMFSCFNLENKIYLLIYTYMYTYTVIYTRLPDSSISCCFVLCIWCIISNIWDSGCLLHVAPTSGPLDDKHDITTLCLLQEIITITRNSEQTKKFGEIYFRGFEKNEMVWNVYKMFEVNLRYMSSSSPPQP